MDSYRYVQSIRDRKEVGLRSSGSLDSAETEVLAADLDQLVSEELFCYLGLLVPCGLRCPEVIDLVR